VATITEKSMVKLHLCSQICKASTKARKIKVRNEDLSNHDMTPHNTMITLLISSCTTREEWGC